MSLDAMKQALEALESNPDAMVDCGDGHWDFKRDLAITALRAAIEQAEKQEPVAWVGPSWLNPETRTWESESFAPRPIKGWIPLYAAPRQWQGLTKREVDAWDLPERPTVFEFAQFVEAKLKEKNG